MKLHRLGRLGEGTIWSVLGLVLPLAAALVSIPVLVGALGTERFGILTLCWALGGYFNLFDMGLGRALVLRISRLEGTGRGDDVPATFWTGTVALAVLGLGLGILCAAASLPLARGLLRIPPVHELETVLSLVITGATLPFALAFGGFGNFLVATHRQRELNLVRIPTGIVSHLGAAGIAMWGGDLVDLALLGLALRVVSIGALWAMAHRIRPMSFVLSRLELLALLGMGSWMMVTNLAAPLATQLDRFLVGRLAGLSAVAHYSTSMDLALKAWMLLASIAPVLLPVLGELVVKDRDAAKSVFHKALVATFCAALPLLGAMQLMGHLALSLWIDPVFADAAWKLLAVMSSGALASLVANLAFNLVQAIEGPKRTAIAHLILLPVHLGLVLLLVPRMGAMGGAIAFVVRYILEASAFLWMASGHGMLGAPTWRALSAAAILHVVALGGFLTSHVVGRGAIVCGAFAFCLLWWNMLRRNGAVQNPRT
jgi:O-antigen/teichoic acid export membrane protein